MTNEDDKKLFKKLNSEYIRLCRINDVLDELYDGDEQYKLHPEYTENGKTNEANGVTVMESGEIKIDDDYMRYYGSSIKTKVDYRTVLDMLINMYEKRDKNVEVAPEDKTKLNLENIDDDPIKAMKKIAYRFYSSIFPADSTKFSREMLTRVESIMNINGQGTKDGFKYGKLRMYTKDEAEAMKLPKNGSNRGIKSEDGSKKHAVCLCLEKDDNGKPIPTFQKLYTLVHEISHSLKVESGQPNTRTGNMFGETESMIIESLFSHFLLQQDDIIIPEKEKRILNYEHGSSRIRLAGELLSIYKLGAQFYQREQETENGINVESDRLDLDYEDESLQKQVFNYILGREPTQEEIEKINNDLEFYKGWKPSHVLNNYFSPRYTIGNTIAPYMVNIFLKDQQKGLEYLENFWKMAYGRKSDEITGKKREYTMVGALESIGIEGKEGLDILINEYNEWINLASSGKLFTEKEELVTLDDTQKAYDECNSEQRKKRLETFKSDILDKQKANEGEINRE